MASISRKVFGGRRLSDNLQGLSKTLAGRIARKATSAAAGILQSAARLNINVITGKGRRSVKKRKAKRTKDDTATEVYSDYRTLKPDAYYTAFLEYGWTTSTGRFVDEYKWMQPAFDSSLPTMISTMQRIVTTEVAAVASRSGGRRRRSA